MQSHQKNERISDLMNRSGGFKNMAYLKGATLIRLTEFAELKSDLTKKIKNLNDLKIKVSSKKRYFNRIRGFIN